MEVQTPAFFFLQRQRLEVAEQHDLCQSLNLLRLSFAAELLLGTACCLFCYACLTSAM
jgi:hypothetical protein